VVLGFEPIQVVALGRDQSHNGHERGDRMALTVKRPGAARGLEGQAAIGTDLVEGGAEGGRVLLERPSASPSTQRPRLLINPRRAAASSKANADAAPLIMVQAKVSPGCWPL
jgi:hypothetical protein